MMFSNPNTRIPLDERQWVIDICSFFEEDLDDDDGNGVLVCIFHVPNSVKATKPEDYSPQQIALGPYHHWREDLYKLEKYKLVSVKKVQSRFQNLEMQQLVAKLIKMDAHVRGSYHKFFDMDGETLAWMMAIDGIFLLFFLYTYTDRTLAASFATSPRLAQIFTGSSGKKFEYDAILKDIMMLENQVPTIVLREIMHAVQYPSLDKADTMLSDVLMDICKEISPLQYNKDNPCVKAIERLHLLDLLYHLIVPPQDEPQQQQQSSEEQEIKSTDSPQSKLIDDMKTLNWVWKLLSKHEVGVVRIINVAIMLPIKVIARILGLPDADSVLPSNEESHISILESEDSGRHLKAPLVEQIMIPTVTALSDAGIEFCPTEGGITSIKFDAQARKFHLPVVHLDSSTEIIMRNLVAYEALAFRGRPLVLARYTELMNGIIDNSEDAKLLREKKIIVNRLKSDQEAADLWNGMSRAIVLTKVTQIDNAIVEANAYYNSTPKRKFYLVMRKYVYGSWKILIVIATFVLLVLMVLQSFCSVYNCPSLFKESSADDS